MRLPSGDQAIIDTRKILDYCLDTKHDEGRHKARRFREALGLHAGNAHLLVGALTTAAAQAEAVPGVADRYGQRYVIDFLMDGPRGRTRVRSARIVRTGESTPRLVTCYII